MHLQQRLIELPPGMDVADFILSDGKAPAAVAKPVAKTTLASLLDLYLETHAGAYKEASLRTARIHFTHLAATLGERFPLSELKPADLQRHIQRRAALGISPVTIKKETDGQIAKGKLDEVKRVERWDCLSLRVAEIGQLLTCVRERALHPWIYPLACLAAPSSVMWVKSEAASRPGSWFWAKNTSLGGPSRARQSLMRR